VDAEALLELFDATDASRRARFGTQAGEPACPAARGA
jgi:hypothetical protein